jgi:hypothetical protein
MNITLEDVLNGTPEQVMQKLRQPTPVVDDIVEMDAKPPVEIIAENPVEEENANIVKSPFDTSVLKHKFDSNTVFSIGNSFNVNGNNYLVVGVIPSAGRVKFKDETHNVIRSVPVYYLTGETPVVPFTKGQKVLFKDEICEVKRLNPANGNLVIAVNGQNRYVKMSKVKVV